MKFSVFFVSICIFLNLIIATNAQSISENENLSDKLIQEFQILDKNIILTLSDISSKYEIPIGLEVSPQDNLLDAHNDLSINMKNVKLREILDEIIRQNSLYSWEIKNNVINFFPKTHCRDTILADLLKTEINNISINNQTRRFNFRQLISTSPELLKILEINGVRFENDVFSARDISPLGGDFSLKASNLKIESILNYIIYHSKTKYWIVNRYGDQRQFILLNL